MSTPIAFWVERYHEQGMTLYGVIRQERGRKPRQVGFAATELSVAKHNCDVAAHSLFSEKVWTVRLDWTMPLDPETASRAAWVVRSEA